MAHDWWSSRASQVRRCVPACSSSNVADGPDMSSDALVLLPAEVLPGLPVFDPGADATSTTTAFDVIRAEDQRAGATASISVR